MVETEYFLSELYELTSAETTNIISLRLLREISKE